MGPALFLLGLLFLLLFSWSFVLWVGCFLVWLVGDEGVHILFTVYYTDPMEIFRPNVSTGRSNLLV